MDETEPAPSVSRSRANSSILGLMAKTWLAQSTLPLYERKTQKGVKP